MNFEIRSRGRNIRMSRKTALVALASVAILFLFAFPLNLVSADAESSSPSVVTNMAPAPQLAPGLLTIYPITLHATNSATLDCTKSKGCVYVTDMSANDIQIIQGTKDVGSVTLPSGSCSMGDAYAPNVKAVYVADYCTESVEVINAKTQNVTTSINIGNTPSGVTYSTASDMIYVTTISAPGTVVVINPETNAVVTTITTCGWYPEYIDQANGGNVYAVDWISWGGPGCVDEINPLNNTLVNSVSIDGYGSGVAVNQANKDVYVNGAQCQCVFVFTPSLKLVTNITFDGYFTHANWANDKLKTVYIPVGNGVFPIYKNNTAGSMITGNFEEADGGGCGSGKLNYSPNGNEVVVVKDGEVLTYISTNGSELTDCTATVTS